MVDINIIHPPPVRGTKFVQIPLWSILTGRRDEEEVEEISSDSSMVDINQNQPEAKRKGGMFRFLYGRY